jgi:hypothetical protein
MEERKEEDKGMELCKLYFAKFFTHILQEY